MAKKTLKELMDGVERVPDTLERRLRDALNEIRVPPDESTIDSPKTVLQDYEYEGKKPLVFMIELYRGRFTFEDVFSDPFLTITLGGPDGLGIRKDAIAGYASESFFQKLAESPKFLIQTFLRRKIGDLVGTVYNFADFITEQDPDYQVHLNECYRHFVDKKYVSFFLNSAEGKGELAEFLENGYKSQSKKKEFLDLIMFKHDIFEFYRAVINDFAARGTELPALSKVVSELDYCHTISGMEMDHALDVESLIEEAHRLRDYVTQLSEEGDYTTKLEASMILEKFEGFEKLYKIGHPIFGRIPSPYKGKLWPSSVTRLLNDLNAKNKYPQQLRFPLGN